MKWILAAARALGLASVMLFAAGVIYGIPVGGMMLMAGWCVTGFYAIRK